MTERSAKETWDPHGLEVLHDATRHVVFVGALDVSPAVTSIQTHFARNQMGFARVTIHSSWERLGELDLSGEVRIDYGETDGQRIFTGEVVSATAEAATVELYCEVMPDLQKPMPGRYVNRAHVSDLLYILLREGGIPDERLNLEGLDGLGPEVFEVIVPLVGLSISERISVGQVGLVEGGVEGSIRSASEGHELAGEMLAHRAFALTYVASRRLFWAQEEAVRRIDAALAWVNLQLRYPNVVRPDGSIRSWSREVFGQACRRSGFISVRGLSSGRSTVRELKALETQSLTLDRVDDDVVLNQCVPTESALRAAIVAAARAATSDEPLTRVAAISECLEFYAGSTRMPKIIDRPDRRRLLQVASDLGGDKEQRIRDLVGMLNHAPLLSRVRRQLTLDEVPYSDEDMALLERVRRIRNDAVHGRTERADDTEIDRCVALLARVLAFAVRNRSRAADPLR